MALLRVRGCCLLACLLVPRHPRSRPSHIVAIRSFVFRNEEFFVLSVVSFRGFSLHLAFVTRRLSIGIGFVSRIFAPSRVPVSRGFSLNITRSLMASRKISLQPLEKSRSHLTLHNSRSLVKSFFSLLLLLLLIWRDASVESPCLDNAGCFI